MNLSNNVYSILSKDDYMSEKIKRLEEIAQGIRETCVEMAHESNETHLSSALSCVDLLTALFGNWMSLSVDDPKAQERDRFIMSKGHGCSALYAVMAVFGYIDKNDLKCYSKTGSHLPNHPCKHALPLLEMSSGSLGHGLGVATGMLYADEIMSRKSFRAIVLMSDGECNEGSVWESAMFAAAHRMDRLIAIVDYNGFQAVGKSDEIMGNTSLKEKFESFGWAAMQINGNSMDEIIGALKDIPFVEGKPSVIIAKTTSGYGISFMENNQLWFYRSPDKNDLDRALKELKIETTLSQ
jgi:transketolase